MVQVSIQPIKNLNHGGRFYPISGYLGLTKLAVEGVVRTRIEDDHRQLPAHSITVSVKCYEARTKLTYSRVNTLVDVTQVLWSSSTKLPTEIGDMDLPFRLILPPSVAGHSTLSFPEYRIFWRLEAAINHPRQFGLGDCQTRVYDLALTRYDIPKAISPMSQTFSLVAASPRNPALYYRIKPLEQGVGPGEELPLIVSVQLPDAHWGFQLHSLSAILYRRLDLFEASISEGTPETPIKHPSLCHDHFGPSSKSHLTRLTASRSTPYLPSYQLSHKRSNSPPSSPSPPLPSPQVYFPSKCATSSIASAHTAEFYRDPRLNLIEARTTLVLPAKPSPNQWPIGEPLRTALATVRFEIHVKLCISSSMGPTELNLQPVEVQLSPVSQEQRSIVAAKVAKKRAAREKSTSKSRKSSPAPSTSGSSRGDSEVPPPVPRTPHSDEYLYMSNTEQASISSHESRGEELRRSRNQSSKRQPFMQDIPSLSHTAISHTIGVTREISASHDITFGSTFDSGLKRMPSHAIRDWEAELERIMSQSKIKSDAMRCQPSTDHGHSDAPRAPRLVRMRRCTIATQPTPVGNGPPYPFNIPTVAR